MLFSQNVDAIDKRSLGPQRAAENEIGTVCRACRAITYYRSLAVSFTSLPFHEQISVRNCLKRQATPTKMFSNADRSQAFLNVEVITKWRVKSVSQPVRAVSTRQPAAVPPACLAGTPNKVTLWLKQTVGRKVSANMEPAAGAVLAGSENITLILSPFKR